MTTRLRGIQEVMTDPVLGLDGVSYERGALVAYLHASGDVPTPGSPTDEGPGYRLVPNIVLRCLISQALSR